MQNSGSKFAFKELLFPIHNKDNVSPNPQFSLCILQKPAKVHG